MMSESKAKLGAAIGLVFVFMMAVGLTLLSRTTTENPVHWFLFWCLIGGVGQYLVRKYAGDLITAPRLFFLSTLIAAIGLCGIPLLEDDYYRYLWDGWLTVSSGTPYGVAPAHFFSDTSVPQPMQRVLDGINNPHIPTIYGPVLQVIFAFSYSIGPANIFPLQCLLTFAHLSLVSLMLRRLPPSAVMLYAFNPLVFKEVILTAHPDVLVALCLWLVWLSWQANSRIRQAFAGVFFGLALGIKLIAAPIALWFLARQRWIGFVFAPIVLFASYSCFESRASDHSGLLVFTEHWQFNAGPYQWLSMVFGLDESKLMVAAIATLLIVFFWWRAPEIRSIPPWHRVMASILLLSPVVNPWYLIWGLPFACAYRERWPWICSYALLLSYCTGLHLPREEIHAYAVWFYAALVQWAIIVFAILFDLFRAKQNSNSSSNLLQME